MSDYEIDGAQEISGGLVSAVKSLSYTGIYIGIVTDAKDYTRTGRVKVSVSALGFKPDADIPPDSNGLRPGEVYALYGTPFGGITNASENDFSDADARDYKLAQQSYGFSMQPPDRNNRVLLCFAQGNLKDAYILSCLVGPLGKNMMLGGNTGSALNYSGAIGTVLPVTEKSLIDPVDQEGTDHPRPVYLDAAEPIVKQGLVHDGIRGTTKNGPKSSVTSHVFSILTPGPKSPNPEDPESFRLPGHSFTLDDTPDNQHIRLRSGGGNQILLNDAEGIIYLVNKDGTAWVELAKDGSINVFGEGSLNMRAKGSFNLRADKDVNIEAGKNLKLKASGDMSKGEYVGMPVGYETKMHTGAAGSGGTVHIESLSGTTIQAGTNAVLDAQTGDLNLKAANRLAADARKIDIISTIKNPPVGDTDMIGGINISSAGGPVGILGTTGLNLVGTAGIGLAGVPILLNSAPGFAGIVPQIGLPGKGAKHITMIDHPDFKSAPPKFDRDNIDNLLPTNGDREETDGVQSITSVMPTAEPYAGHYVSSALADSNKGMMEEDNSGASDTEVEATATNDPHAGYKTEIKNILEKVQREKADADLEAKISRFSSLNIPGLDLLSSIDPNDPMSLANLSSFDIGSLMGPVGNLMNYEGYLQGLLAVEFPFNIPTVNSLLGDYVIGYGINLPEYMNDLKQIQIDLNGLMADAQNLANMANDPMGMINSIAGDSISQVTKDLGITNIKSIGDVSSLSSAVMNKTGMSSDQLNTMVNDVTNEIGLGEDNG